jgi:pimeloyl-ACP methyl ester carboxylesterase
MKTNLFFVMLVGVFILNGCQGNQPQAVETVETTAPTPPIEESEPAAQSVPTHTAVPQPSSPSPTDAPEVEPTNLPPTLVPETAVSEPITENVTIEAADGLLLHATYYGPGGIGPFPGVILLHMLGSNRQVWEDVGFTEALLTEGYAVLALDMRGHGDSGSNRDWQQADDDLEWVWNYFVGLENIDGERTAVIGASIGSNIALRTGANEPAVKTTVLLSPGLDYRGVTTEDAVEKYGSRPILIVASEEDTYSANSSKTLAELAQGEVELQMYNGAGHGTDMFGPQPDLTEILLNWLEETL